jgi:nucleoside-diphosphate-sugar epimerase
VDLTDYGQTLQALSRIEDRYDGIDGIVHLAAVPAPGLVPNTTTFVDNITCTHHVFAAARAAGITTVVWASSETVLGLPFDTPPPYVPVDEGYHPRPESSYSLAKTLEEEMAAQLCRWDPTLTMVGLRFSNVMYPEDYADFPSYDADPMLRKWNLWGYIDARDGAQACRLALELEATGCEVFVIANADTVMSTPSVDLLARVFPGVEVRGEVSGTQTLLSIEKARRVLGYQPRHSWRDEVLPDGGA